MLFKQNVPNRGKSIETKTCALAHNKSLLHVRHVERNIEHLLAYQHSWVATVVVVVVTSASGLGPTNIGTSTAVIKSEVMSRPAKTLHSHAILDDFAASDGTDPLQ
jgi:hypothetical protein